MGTTTKRRGTPRPRSGIATRRVINHFYDPFHTVTSTGSGSVNVDWALPETQVTVSENHPQWRDHKYGRFSGDYGGEFLMQRRWTEGVKDLRPNTSIGKVFDGAGRIVTDVTRHGPILPASPSSYGFPSYFASSNSVLDAFGAKAIANCKPTNSCVDLSTFLGETLREGIPRVLGSSIWKSKTAAAKKVAADEYLSYQFGWRPIANDIGKTAAAIWNADSTLRQFQRDSGRLVHRRFEFPPEISETVSTLNDPWDCYIPNDHGSLYIQPLVRGKLVRVRKTARLRWFSGAFTYYMPSRGNALDSMFRAAQEAKKLLGLSLDPSTVWNLSPWSWAVDWFTNAGDVLSNLTDWATYGLCLRYGYMMEHTVSIDEYTYVGKSPLKSGGLPLRMRLCSETKLRRRANPFGFGVTWGGLNPIQLSILAALGISRGGSK